MKADSSLGHACCSRALGLLSMLPLIVNTACLARTFSDAGLLANSGRPSDASSSAEQRLKVGRYQSRAILNCAPIQTNRSETLAIMIPGSGSNGPEEMAPADMTLDGKDVSLFEPIASSFRNAGLHTLQLGKPGVEYFSTWDQSKWFYDQKMYSALKWKDLLDNVQDAISFTKSTAPCGSKKIVLVGHSEGTMVAIDVADANRSVDGIILLGYTGGPYKNILDWQLFERPFEWLIAKDVDANHDGFVTRSEADQWPGVVSYPWRSIETQVSIDTLRALQRQNSKLVEVIENFKNSPLVSDGIWDRPSIHEKAAGLAQPILAFTGENDIQTPVSEINALLKACRTKQKSDCEGHVVPGLGHAFSPLRGPRAQPLLDATLGPVSENFVSSLSQAVVSWTSLDKKSN
ncbi:alpha/beta hydrolase [bacterium]|nr:alpha/beta hydrolase [bacterium]